VCISDFVYQRKTNLPVQDYVLGETNFFGGDS
jgi:hypothetical protein